MLYTNNENGLEQLNITTLGTLGDKVLFDPTYDLNGSGYAGLG